MWSHVSCDLSCKFLILNINFSKEFYNIIYELHEYSLDEKLKLGNFRFFLTKSSMVVLMMKILCIDEIYIYITKATSLKHFKYFI